MLAGLVGPSAFFRWPVGAPAALSLLSRENREEVEGENDTQEERERRVSPERGQGCLGLPL